MGEPTNGVHQTRQRLFSLHQLMQRRSTQCMLVSHGPLTLQPRTAAVVQCSAAQPLHACCSYCARRSLLTGGAYGLQATGGHCGYYTPAHATCHSTNAWHACIGCRGRPHARLIQLGGGSCSGQGAESPMPTLSTLSMLTLDAESHCHCDGSRGDAVMAPRQD